MARERKPVVEAAGPISELVRVLPPERIVGITVVGYVLYVATQRRLIAVDVTPNPLTGPASEG